MKIILIGGTRKSGTTVFQSLFDGHKDIVCPPHDLNIFYSFYPYWTNSKFSRLKLEVRLYKVTVEDWLMAYKKTVSTKELYHIKIKLKKYFKINVKKINIKNINELFNFVVNLASAPFKKKKFILLKETSAEFVLPFLKKKIFFLNLIRDPRDILSALLPGLKSKYKMINEDYYSLIFSTFFRYHFSYKIMKNLNFRNIQVQNIKFEKLVNKPENIMRLICKKIGIKFDKILLQPTKNKKIYFGNNLDKKKFYSLSKKNTHKWSKRLDFKSIKYIEALLSETIKKNKYNIQKVDTKHIGEIYAILNNHFFFKDRFEKKLNFY